MSEEFSSKPKQFVVNGLGAFIIILAALLGLWSLTTWVASIVVDLLGNIPT